MTREEIVPRLDAIEQRKLYLLTNRFAASYPCLTAGDISRLADALVASRIRLLAEDALALLPTIQAGRLLAGAEADLGST